ncbi:hypothetical protein ACPC37_18800 [Streptomyces griseoincarnatus]|uniref:hypothetical protein n=1 Tax=Streptomyces sp. HNS054 TaxID=1662446 RepID=UPI00069DCE4D|nr:hypothetical protein [Streptomyces sp. HNS054]WPW21127.1 hypothetical protein UBV09_21635 [Streptomyces griseoincarnatus]
MERRTQRARSVVGGRCQDDRVRTAAEAFTATPPARLTEGFTPADPAAAGVHPTIVRERG